ncbi:DKNYY domain-containing protein [Zhouia amylolytica]|uniref:DKNYY domain-containing protein n=1 Tax=Zhouia amylolytica TaxID=376730 RepID=UPI0020CCDFF7|nr:DKNYY domain-containing protein [Zhouia amylolytica]MCQ0110569.1 DKNYY domain-containing protein [Zhouia amylolytica]
MTFITNHPYLSLTAFILILNFAIKKFTRSQHTPLAQLWLFCISILAQACSPFSGPVDKSVSDSYYYSKTKKDICYSPMGNWFELGNTKLNADVNSFSVIGRDFGKDKNHLYFKYHIIDNEVDTASFRVSDDDYLCFDKNNVYVAFSYSSIAFRDANQENKHLWKITDADPKTFTRIDHNWAKDDAHYFYNHKPVAVDYPTFTILNSNFAKDKDSVYALKSYQLLSITSADPASTIVINDRYIADKNAVYDFQEYQNQKITDSLSSIPYQSLKDLRILMDQYLIFDSKVVYDGVLIDKADAATFEIIEHPYTKDKNHVFYYGTLMESADTNTFEVFENKIYAKDKDQIFAYGKPLKEADVTTFGPSENKHSLLYRDKNHTYRGDEILLEK